jgi:hypothetical protein
MGYTLAFSTNRWPLDTHAKGKKLVVKKQTLLEIDKNCSKKKKSLCCVQYFKIIT